MNRFQEACLGIDCRNVCRPGFRVERRPLLEFANLSEGISVAAGREWISRSDAPLDQIAGQVGAKAGG
ncbi:hypothetical protein [Pseudomonas sp. P5_A2_2]